MAHRCSPRVSQTTVARTSQNHKYEGGELPSSSHLPLDGRSVNLGGSKTHFDNSTTPLPDFALGMHSGRCPGIEAQHTCRGERQLIRQDSVHPLPSSCDGPQIRFKVDRYLMVLVHGRLRAVWGSDLGKKKHRAKTAAAESQLAKGPNSMDHCPGRCI
jgi:hypothetical protein